MEFDGRQGGCDCVFDFYGEHCEFNCTDAETCSDHGVCVENGALPAGIRPRKMPL